MMEEQLEKIGAALQGILDVLRSIDDTLRGPSMKIEPRNPEPAAAVTTGEPGPRPAILPLSRAEIREKLDSLGVQYNDRLRTDTLAKILEQEIAKQVKDGTVKLTAADGKTDKAEEVKDLFGMPVQAEIVPKTPEKIYTLEEAIDLAKRLAAKFGPQKSVDIIKDFQCDKISEIEAKGKLQEFAAKILEKEKEYERR